MNRRKLWVAFALAAVLSTAAWAQRIEIMPFAGVRTGGSFSVNSADYNTFTVKGSAAYGVALAFQTSPFAQFELMWSRSDSTVAGTVIIQPLMTEDLFKAHMDQFHLNFLGLLPRGNSRLVPYLLAGLGLTYANPYGEAKGITRFSWSLGGGVKAMIGERIGLRFQGKWNPTYVNTRTGVWCDWWGFCYAVPISKSLNQGEFTGGLFFRF